MDFSAFKFLLLCSLAFCSAPLFADDPTMYYLGERGVSAADLPPSIKQQLFEAEMEKYLRMEQILDGAVLEQYLNKLAEQSKKPRSTIEADLFTKIEVSDKEAETWYGENKAMLAGREFATIKGEIIPYLKRMKQDKIKQDLLTKIKKEQKYRVALVKPEAPVLAINTAGFPHKGAANPKVTIVEFADYRCPHCKSASQVLKKVVEKFNDKVAFYFLDFPLHEGTASLVVAEGAVCAEEQQKFWEYHYAAFAEQETLSDASPLALANTLKLDTAKFTACMQRPAAKERVAAGKQEGVRIGVGGTPAIYLNGKKTNGYTEQDLLKSIQALL